MSNTTDSRLGMTGREDSWNYANDEKWFSVLSAKELVFACGEEDPTLSAQRALGLLIEEFGPDGVTTMVGDPSTSQARPGIADPSLQADS